jgi:hypothetical protein
LRKDGHQTKREAEELWIWLWISMTTKMKKQTSIVESKWIHIVEHGVPRV